MFLLLSFLEENAKNHSSEDTFNLVCGSANGVGIRDIDVQIVSLVLSQ